MTAPAPRTRKGSTASVDAPEPSEQGGPSAEARPAGSASSTRPRVTLPELVATAEPAAEQPAPEQPGSSVDSEDEVITVRKRKPATITARIPKVKPVKRRPVRLVSDAEEPRHVVAEKPVPKTAVEPQQQQQDVREVTTTPTDKELASYMLRQCREGMNATPVVERALTWSDVDEYPGACMTVDNWFVSFEAKLAAAQVPREKWAKVFMECPKVKIEYKRTVAARGLASPVGQPAMRPAIVDVPSPRVEAQGEEPEYFTAYDRIRRYLLRSHGPVLPLGMFEEQIWSVKADTREEVVAQLEG